MRYPEKTI